MSGEVVHPVRLQIERDAIPALRMAFANLGTLRAGR
jgi:hypothetical protein